MSKISLFVLALGLLFVIFSCKANNNKIVSTEEETEVRVPRFNADSAYRYVEAQVNFGPRVPNTSQHVACGEYLAGKLIEFGAQVTNQYADLIGHDGTILKARNIIGSYLPESKRRVLLFAHWDCRPWADSDPDEANHRKPVLGANDGASGVGVLLEVARQIQAEAPSIGIDIIFFDAEDYGAYNTDDTWCLGSQYWARYPHTEGYNARFGILLDMVGGKGATFYREGYSEKYAKEINKKVWKAAKELGFGRTFIDERGSTTIDDHLPVNKLARIPSIDIVPCQMEEGGGFGHFWHTVNDTMENIDKNTLNAVGQTVLHVIYNEK